ncbi:MAG: PspA/IM30 family protein [Angelakisella sp.]|jgi:phage shock protein A|nr:PspA/IM30 family protein [Angelakisella sp.]
MGILDRFSTIVKSNINALLDKAEDPGKMIDQYLLEMTESLADVKKETAGVMAEESRTRAKVEANQAEVDKYAALAKKALQAGNEADAKVFIAKKQQLETSGQGLLEAYEAARENAQKMRQMHDKLVENIEELKRRREAIKAKVAVARTQGKLNEIGAASDKAEDAMSAFQRMEEKADRMLQRETAMAELNAAPKDEAAALEEKYSGAGATAVDDELAKMKAELGL